MNKPIRYDVFKFRSIKDVQLGKALKGTKTTPIYDWGPYYFGIIPYPVGEKYLLLGLYERIDIRAARVGQNCLGFEVPDDEARFLVYNS